MDRVYLRKMHSHLWSARMCRDNPDEQGLNDAAYMLQQTVEIGLKQILRELGVNYSKVHEIETLLNKVPDLNFWFPEDFIDTLYDKAPTLTSWESLTRYNDDYLPARSRVIALEKIVELFVSYVDDGFERLDETAKRGLQESSGKLDGVRRIDFE